MTFNVFVIGVGLAAKYTSWDPIGVWASRAVWGTYPSFKGQMERLLVPLPSMLRAESLRAEGTLKGIQRRRQGRLRVVLLFDGAPFPPLPESSHGAKRTSRVLALERVS